MLLFSYLDPSNQCCGGRNFYPGFKSSNKRGGGVFLTFFVATNFTKLSNLSQLTKNYSTFYPKKLSLSSQKYLRVRDPGYEIRDTRIQGSKRHLIPDSQHWIQPSLNYHSRYVSCPNLFPSLTYLYVEGGGGGAGINIRRQQKKRGDFQ
jgi:hypothetical protein